MEMQMPFAWKSYVKLQDRGIKDFKEIGVYPARQFILLVAA